MAVLGHQSVENCGLTWKQEGLHLTYPTWKAGPGTPMGIGTTCCWLRNSACQWSTPGIIKEKAEIWSFAQGKIRATSLAAIRLLVPLWWQMYTHSHGVVWLKSNQVVFQQDGWWRRFLHQPSTPPKPKNSCHPSCGPSRRWEGKVSDCSENPKPPS